MPKTHWPHEMGREAALDEAAAICDQYHEASGKYLAERIRHLKQKENYDPPPHA